MHKRQLLFDRAWANNPASFYGGNGSNGRNESKCAKASNANRTALFRWRSRDDGSRETRRKLFPIVAPGGKILSECVKLPHVGRVELLFGMLPECRGDVRE